MLIYFLYFLKKLELNKIKVKGKLKTRKQYTTLTNLFYIQSKKELFDIVSKIYILAQQHSFKEFVARFASKELDYLYQSSQVLQLSC